VDLLWMGDVRFPDVAGTVLGTLRDLLTQVEQVS
jgi:hypothetical protein